MAHAWYIIHTLSGQEQKVLDSINKRLDVEEMGAYIKEVFVAKEKVVDVRAGEKMVKRRRSFTHFFSELMVFPMMYRNGYINLMHLIINMSGRLILRIMPRGLTSYLYSIALRQSR